MREYYEFVDGKPVVKYAGIIVDLNDFLNEARQFIVGQPKTIENLNGKCITKQTQVWILEHIQEIGEHTLKTPSNVGFLSKAANQYLEDVKWGL